MNEKNISYGKLYIVGTPIGNMKDITYRAVETLQNVDVILAEDTRQTKKLLERYDIKKACISYHRHNEVEKINQVISMLCDGKNIALVSDAGMPRISDPGEKLIQTLIENKMQLEVIPGVTALTTAIAGCKFDATTFVFIGFLPMRPSRRHAVMENMKNEKKLMVLYEAPHKILATLKDLYKVMGNRNICVARELTKIYEEYVHTDIAQEIALIEQNGIKGEIVLIIEGAGDKELNENSEIMCEDVCNLVNEKLKQGYTKNEAIKQVAKQIGKKKQEVYMECVKNGNE